MFQSQQKAIKSYKVCLANLKVSLLDMYIQRKTMKLTCIRIKL